MGSIRLLHVFSILAFVLLAVIFVCGVVWYRSHAVARMDPLMHSHTKEAPDLLELSGDHRTVALAVWQHVLQTIAQLSWERLTSRPRMIIIIIAAVIAVSAIVSVCVVFIPRADPRSHEPAPIASDSEYRLAIDHTKHPKDTLLVPIVVPVVVCLILGIVSIGLYFRCFKHGSNSNDEVHETELKPIEYRNQATVNTFAAFTDVSESNQLDDSPAPLDPRHRLSSLIDEVCSANNRLHFGDGQVVVLETGRGLGNPKVYLPPESNTIAHVNALCAQREILWLPKRKTLDQADPGEKCPLIVVSFNTDELFGHPEAVQKGIEFMHAIRQAQAELLAKNAAAQ